MSRVRFFLTSVSVAALFLITTQTAQAAVGDLDSRASTNWSTASTWIKKLTGSAAFVNGNSAVVGTGTLFTTELAPGDVLMLQGSPATVRGTVSSITDNTHLTLTAGSSGTGSGAYGKQAVPTSADGLVTITNDVTVTAAASASSVLVINGGSIAINSGVGLAVTNALDLQVTINSSVAINISGSGTLSAGSMTWIPPVGGGTSYGSIAVTLLGSGNISVTGAVLVASLSGSATLDIGAGTASLGSLAIDARSGTGGRISEVKVGTGTLTVSGNVSFPGNATNSRLTFTGIGTVNVGGDFGSGGTLTTVLGSTIKFNGSGTNTMGSYATYQNVEIAETGGGSIALSGSSTVNGVLTLTSGDVTTGANTLNMALNATSAGTTDVVGNVKRTHVFTTGTSYAFGNPNVTVNFTSVGGKPTALNINLAKSAPTNFTNAVTRTYDITPTSPGVFTATLRLHYLTSELNGNTEGTLTLWKEITAGNWSSQGNSGQNTTPPDNWVEWNAVTGFSRWTLSSNAPTDVAMVNMKATRFDDRVLLEWQTGYEVRNLGFNIYREQKGIYTRINPEPVAGSALLFGPKVALSAGFAYAWWDKGIANCGSRNADCEDTRYWIEDLDLSGHSSMHGPFGVERSTSGDAASAARKQQAPLLGAIGNNAARLGSSAPVERLATLLKPAAARFSLQAAVASQQAVKLSVKHEGWYRVEQADLVTAGFPANADAPNLQLFVDGQEVPILVTTSANAVGKGARATSAPWDGIEFYGIGIDSAFTDSHVYWLVAGSGKGLRINTVPSDGGAPAPFSFPHAVERRDKIVYFSSLKNGGGEKFFGPLIYNAQPVDQSLDLQHVAPTGLATLDVGLQGFTDATHSVRVLLNGSELGTVQFAGVAKGTAQYAIPQTSLLEGGNQVQLISPAGYSDISVVEYLRMTYQHTNTADGNALRFPGTGGEQATIGGFTSGTVRVLDITDAATPQEVNASVTQDDAEYSVTVTVPGVGARTLLAFGVDQKKTPASLVANQPSSWRSPKNGANYVAVTRKDLVDSLQLLIKQRRNQGLKVSAVDIEDVYDEFSFGNKTPQALKDFFSYAKSSWKIPPRFALLAGDATYDPKNYTGAGDNDLVPTKLVETGFTETATDDWLVDFDGDSIPDIAIGRLPVRSAQESAELAAKIVRYDGSEANRRVVLVADHNDGHDFEAADSQLQALLPANLSVTDIRRGQVGDSTARTQLLDALNLGAKLVNYYGHGSTLVWTNASILTAADAASLANTDRLALFDAMTCFNGFFHDVSIDSLGEALLKSPGGAIAVWASTGMTDPVGQVLMNEEAIRQLFSGAGLTIGEVTARAKGATSNADVRRTWVLLGDPATKLK